MSKNDLKIKDGIFISHASDPGRMAGLMQQWWAGESQAQLAKEHGITPQRVGQLLAWAGCTAEIWRKAKKGRADSPRRAAEQRAMEALELLRHPLAGKLTVRQRSALLWLSQGLILTDIARRMATSAQAVRYFLVGARWRLERLSGGHGQSNAGQAVDSSALDGCDLGGLLSDPSSPIEDAPANVEALSALPVDATPQIEFDEPDDRETQLPAEPVDDAVKEAVAEPRDTPQSPPEISEADLSPTSSRPQSPLERKPIRLSDLRPKKPVRWVKLWSSNEHSPW